MAWDINRVVLVGRLSNDVSLTHAPSGSAIAKFGLAVGGRPARDGSGDNASFFNIVVWDKAAEFCGQYLKKGDRIAIDGRLEQRSWTAQDGTRRNTVEVIAERVESLGSPQGQGGGGYTPRPQQSQAPQQAPAPQAAPKKNDDYYDNTDFKSDPIDYAPEGDAFGEDVPF